MNKGSTVVNYHKDGTFNFLVKILLVQVSVCLLAVIPDNIRMMQVNSFPEQTFLPKGCTEESCSLGPKLILKELSFTGQISIKYIVKWTSKHVKNILSQAFLFTKVI